MPLWEEWTLPHLTDAMMAWIKALPASLVVEDVLLSHGTPARDNENWLHRRDGQTDLRPSTHWEAAAAAEGHDHPVILCGHTHLPRMVRLGDGRLLVNPGSVGVPAYVDTRHTPALVAETGAPDARYAVIEKIGADWQASLHMVPYDPTEMIERALEKGAESWVDALRTGWVREEP
jgi:diadenosine tetraphosphatase ApaH/serine/threonine PP2A family protein phosphatase